MNIEKSVTYTSIPEILITTRNYPVLKYLYKQETMNKNIIKERKMSSTDIFFNFFIDPSIKSFTNVRKYRKDDMNTNFLVVTSLRCVSTLEKKLKIKLIPTDI